MTLEGQVAVVTGGSRGVGRATCLRLAEKGAAIAILDVIDPGETVALLEERGASAWFHETDLAQPEQIEQAFVRLDDAWGPPRVHVNVAGVFAAVPALETTPEVWDRMMDVNVRGAFFAAQAAAKRMRTNGGGRIINILSNAAVQGFAHEAAYCASKGAALLMTRTLAVELAQYDITVNGVGPGTVHTDMGAEYLGGGPIAEHELSRTPLGRFGEPEDIAEAVAWMATEARWLTGQALYVDGGFLATGLPDLG